MLSQLTSTAFDAVGVPYHDTTPRVDAIVQQLLSADWFARALARPTGILSWVRTSPSWRVVTSRSDAEGMREELARRCLRGFAVVLVASQPAAALRRLLEQYGYVSGDRAVVGSNEPGDALEVVSASDPIVQCLGTLELNERESAILFAHDADPVYLVEKSDRAY